MQTTLPPLSRVQTPHPGPTANGAAAAVAMRHAAHKTDDPDLERIADDIARHHPIAHAEQKC